MIHEADPQSRSIMITIFTYVVAVRPSVRAFVRPHVLKSRKTKQLLSDNSNRYCRDCGASRVDH